MIYKFYNNSSVLSHGEGSNPTTPTTIESLKDPKDLKDRFFSWATNPEDPVRFELENGAIDAQESINGGVLLVVTGHMYLGEHTCRPFCHTFFLHPFSPPNSTKRSYYVHNDVLRFLQVNTAIGSPVRADEAVLDANAHVIEATTTSEGDDQRTDQPDVAVDQSEQKGEEAFEESKEDETLAVKEALEEAVEESKDDALVEEAVEETKEEVVVIDDSKETDTNKQKKNKGKKNGKSEQFLTHPKPPLGSWASLVASTADKPVQAPAPAPPVIVTPPAPPAEPTSTPLVVLEETEASILAMDPIPSKSATEHVRRHRRDPDHTLVIKNVPDNAKEADIRDLFEPFASATYTKVVGITVSAHRGLAFVDYDSSAPVVAALESSERPFSLYGRVLDMEQKTMDVQRRAARGGGGGNGSAGRNFSTNNSNNTSNNNRSSGENGTLRGGARGSGTRRGVGRDGRSSGSGSDPRGSARAGGRGGR